MTVRTQPRLALVGIAAVLMSAALGTVANAAAPAPSRTIGSANPPSIGSGASTTLKAVVNPVTGSAVPSGTVTFNEGASVVGAAQLVQVGRLRTATLSVMSLATGTHTFTATFGGNAVLAPSTSLPFTVVVGRPASRTVESTFTPTIGLGQNASLRAVVKQIGGTGLPTGTVTFTEGAAVTGVATLATVNGVQLGKLSVPSLAIGTHTFIATYSGSATFATSVSLPVTITVTKGVSTTTVTAPPSKDGLPDDFVPVARVRSAMAGGAVPQGVVTFMIDSLAPQTLALGTTGYASLGKLSFTPGSHTITTTYAGSSTYAVSSGTFTFTAP